MSFIQAVESGALEQYVKSFVDGGADTPTLGEVLTAGAIASKTMNMNNFTITNVSGIFKFASNVLNFTNDGTGGVQIGGSGSGNTTITSNSANTVITSVSGDILLTAPANKAIKVNETLTANYTTLTAITNNAQVGYKIDYPVADATSTNGFVTPIRTFNLPSAGVWAVSMGYYASSANSVATLGLSTTNDNLSPINQYLRMPINTGGNTANISLTVIVTCLDGTTPYYINAGVGLNGSGVQTMFEVTYSALRIA
jgi:hypothetical protein